MRFNPNYVGRAIQTEQRKMGRDQRSCVSIPTTWEGRFRPEAARISGLSPSRFNPNYVGRAIQTASRLSGLSASHIRRFQSQLRGKGDSDFASLFTPRDIQNSFNPNYVGRAIQTRRLYQMTIMDGKSFNPNYVGRAIQTDQTLVAAQKTEGFNPNYVGRAIQTVRVRISGLRR